MENYCFLLFLRLLRRHHPNDEPLGMLVSKMYCIQEA